MATDRHTPARRDIVHDRILRIETPEHVQVSFPLAGPGSRFGALVFDATAIVAIFLFGIYLLSLVSDVGLVSSSFGFALAGLLAVSLLWGYFFAFELWRGGQTPGKRFFGIRTVLDGGVPLNAQAAAVRNLLRFVDLQPLPSCLLGGVAMLLDPKGRRLGDLAAGTVVVRDVPVEFPEAPEAIVGSGDLESPRLEEVTWAAVENFVERAAALPEATRVQLANRLARTLEASAPLKEGDATTLEYVERVYAEELRRRTAARLSSVAGSAAATSLLRVKRDRWMDLRDSVRRLRRARLTKLDEDEVSEFAARYRALSADLARSRTYGASYRMVFALEHLVATAHNLFYRPSGNGLSRARSFLFGGFPALLRRLWRPFLLANLCFYLPGVIGFVLVSGDPDHERLLADATMIERAEIAASDPEADYRDTWESAFAGHDALAAQLIANNVQVSFLVFAGGLLAGLGSIFLLVFNGLHLGVALAVFANRGVLDNIVMFVIGHGAIELTAITIAGTAGLWMGSAVWFPGRESRVSALARRARESVGLMLGVVVLLVVAGLIEGFISPARLPAAAKLAAAAIALAWLVGYLALTGRGARAEGDEPDLRAGPAT